MHSFGECPNEERESRLSQILEVQAHPKYSLSARACQGILRRADRRGKELPEILRKTLIKQSSASPGGGIAETLDASYYKGCGERQGKERTVICLQGNGIDRQDNQGCEGRGWREDQSYTLNTIDRHAVCVGNGQLAQAKISDKVGALNCMHDQQAVLVYGLDRASFNQGQNAQYDFSVEEEQAQTLVRTGPGGVLTKR